MEKTKIYGASDDLIEIEGAISDELGCYNNTKQNIKCSDGTRAQIDYNDEGLWKITLLNEGDKFNCLIGAVGDDAKHSEPLAKNLTSYSDVLVLNEGIDWIKIGRKMFRSE